MKGWRIDAQGYGVYWGHDHDKQSLSGLTFVPKPMPNGNDPAKAPHKWDGANWVSVASDPYFSAPLSQANTIVTDYLAALDTLKSHNDNQPVTVGDLRKLLTYWKPV